jgi:FkbM family methyltransferase
MDRYSKTFSALRRQAERLAVFSRLRPGVLATPFYRNLLPYEHRGIVEVDGVRLYVDPITRSGRAILTEGAYEPQTAAHFRERIRPGDTVLDIGANEGVFSALACRLVGPSGCVIAVEPQSRLLDILEINLALNGPAETHIVHGAIGEADGALVEVALYPEANTGASSIARPYRWSRKVERVQTFTVSAALARAGRGRADFVKVDVEGYEPEVVRSLVASLADNVVACVLVDYHNTILKKRNLDPMASHRALEAAGYRAVSGSPLHGYVLYDRAP